MADSKALVWDEVGTREFETGVDKGVLYVMGTDSNGKPEYGAGVAWNGLTGVNESPSGAETTSLYADNIKYLNLLSAEEFGFTIEAYSSPDEFDECDGNATIANGVTIGQQGRKTFAFCYRTKIGNDTDGNDHGYKIHIIYGCTASPSGKDYSTINDSPEAMSLSWEVKTTPVNVTGFKPTATVIIDSTDFTTEDAKAKLKAIENALYGTTTTEPKVLMPDDIAKIVNGESIQTT